MPELPEVETIRNDLQPKLVGCRIAGVRLDWSGVVDTPSAEEFANEVVGHRIESIARRGKYLIFGLSAGKYLIVHLRMTGRLLYREAGEAPDPYTRAVLSIDDGHELRFADLRKFGRMWFVADCGAVLAKVGVEPFSDEFTTDFLAKIMRGRSGPIKSVLLDQSHVAGVGNIYADEALFLAKIHPRRSGGSLSPAEVHLLHDAVRVVLADGISNRGTTFAEYRDAFGGIGQHQETLRVHRRAGQPCLVCGTTIEKITVGGRGTYFCPNCQTIN